MNVQHINIKFFIEKPEEVKLEEYSGIFNSWIQRRVTPELLIDVADYIHVHNGPGVILIGHEADYSLDHRAGRPGLLYNRKAQVDGSVQEKLAQATGAALSAARLLETENGVKFNGRETQVIINDRLLVPNTSETFAALGPDLRTFFDRLYNGTEYTLTYHSVDPRERFTVDVKVATPLGLETLLKNLSVETAHA